MKTQTIKYLAYCLKEAKKENKPAPIFFLGAGASKTGGIPLAGEIINDILERYCDNPSIDALKDDEKTYAKLMECLTPSARNTLLKGYIDQARINVTHIYLAQLMINGYADYVLTVNFDNLMLRALALFNEFPSTYDMAILKDMTTTSFKKHSVVYLHGQHHGLWLLNTKEEMAKVDKIIPPILNKITNERPWIFIGYSADDPIFEHIKKLGRFDNGLYWVSYKDNEPIGKVKEFLQETNKNVFLIKGFDADSFMLKLNSELELPQPDIINKPFSSLKDSLSKIVDVDDKDHFKGVKERLEISKNQVDKAIQQFEEEESETDGLRKEIIALIINENVSEDSINEIETRAAALNNLEINNLLSCLLSNWGVTLGRLAATKTGEDAERLFNQAFEKYARATEIKEDYHEAFNNWGADLGNLAATKTGEDAERLFNQAFEKHARATEIKEDYHEAFYNWGAGLGNLAATKTGEDAEHLSNQAFEKYDRATEIKEDYHEAFNNWGAALGKLAATKTGEDAEHLFNLAFEKHKKAIALGASVYNLACLYALTNKKDKAFHYLEESLNNNEIIPEFVLEDSDWLDYLEDENFKEIISKFI